MRAFIVKLPAIGSDQQRWPFAPIGHYLFPLETNRLHLEPSDTRWSSAKAPPNGQHWHENFDLVIDNLCPWTATRQKALCNLKISSGDRLDSKYFGWLSVSNPIDCFGMESGRSWCFIKLPQMRRSLNRIIFSKLSENHYFATQWFYLSQLFLEYPAISFIPLNFEQITTYSSWADTDKILEFHWQSQFFKFPSVRNF